MAPKLSIGKLLMICIGASTVIAFLFFTVILQQGIGKNITKIRNPLLPLDAEDIPAVISSSTDSNGNVYHEVVDSFHSKEDGIAAEPAPLATPLPQTAVVVEVPHLRSKPQTPPVHAVDTVSPKEDSKTLSNALRGSTTVNSRYFSDSILLIMASNRPEYLEKTLSYIIKYHPKVGFPIVISEDGYSNDVARVINNAISSLPTVPVIHIHHPGYRDRSPNGYFKLSKHFKWALSQLFSIPMTLPEFQALVDANILPQRIVILEEDLQISPDFFEFFQAVTALVDSDPSLLGASAWNDNGQGGLVPYVTTPSLLGGVSVAGNDRLYRSDFFPGLGWMLPRRVWEEDDWAHRWPDAYWDDWLREPKQRKGRHILRPEVCRTYHFGHKGVSSGQYSDYLTKIVLNDHFVPFTTMNLDYLKADEWDSYYLVAVEQARLMTRREVDDLLAQSSASTEVQVKYTSLDNPRDPTSFSSLARWCGAMDNIKANVPRTAYHGIVSIYKKNKAKNFVKLHLVPL